MMTKICSKRLNIKTNMDMIIKQLSFQHIIVEKKNHSHKGDVGFLRRFFRHLGRVTELAQVLDSKSGFCGFDSHLGHYEDVAQLVEQYPFKIWVVSSILTIFTFCQKRITRKRGSRFLEKILPIPHYEFIADSLSWSRAVGLNPTIVLSAIVRSNRTSAFGRLR